jgi:hypothetical protein
MKKEFKGNNKKPAYGKGSERRIEDFRKVQTNWDEIKGFRPSKFPSRPTKEQ